MHHFNQPKKQGTISFPIFVLHGALGQLFYKKIVATKVRQHGVLHCAMMCRDAVV